MVGEKADDGRNSVRPHHLCFGCIKFIGFHVFQEK
jgi:hypothetical protein